MRFLKLAALDVVAAVGLFIVGQLSLDRFTKQHLIATHAERQLAIQFFAGFLSLQPALWARGYDWDLRWQAWLFASGVGVAVYIILELVGTFLFGSGNSAGLMLASLANTIGPLTGVAFCLWWLRRKRAGAVIGSLSSDGSHPRVLPYKRGSWGPRQADALIAEHSGWHNPTSKP